MKYLIGFVFCVAMAMRSSAQVVEVNPNVKWKYVRSQKLDLQSESVYQYEFPADKANDYIFNLFYDKENIVTHIKVLDMQMKPVASISDPKALKTTKLEFNVPASGMYIVVLGYQSKDKSDESTTEIEAILITRPIVE
jgi:hypothetical protein